MNNECKHFSVTAAMPDLPSLIQGPFIGFSAKGPPRSVEDALLKDGVPAAVRLLRDTDAVEDAEWARDRQLSTDTLLLRDGLRTHIGPGTSCPWKGAGQEDSCFGVPDATTARNDERDSSALTGSSFMFAEKSPLPEDTVVLYVENVWSSSFGRSPLGR